MIIFLLIESVMRALEVLKVVTLNDLKSRNGCYFASFHPKQ